jgi:hypothetical protein
MAKNTQLTNLAVNTEADALAALLNAGFIDIYDGAQPATGDTAIGAQTKLARCTFGNPAFGASVAGVITANAITADSDADATGTAAWARILKSDGTPVMDVSVGTAAANIILNSLAIQIHAQVSITSFTHTVAKATSGS